MLNERHTSTLLYDPGSDTLSIRSEDLGKDGSREAQLLLDKKGFLVGIDLYGGDRVVVMLGPHEAVDRTERVTVTVVRGSVVLVRDAKRMARGHEKNPYV
jgi:hypothetical protein